MNKSIKIGKRTLILIRWVKSFAAYGISEKRLQITIQTLPKNMMFNDKHEIIIKE